MGEMKQKMGMGVMCAGAIVALALGAAGPMVWADGPVRAAQAQTADLQAEGQAAVMAFMAALVSGDKTAIAAVLAPEFQVMRSEGGGFDRAGYLDFGLPVIAQMPVITDLSVTASDGLMVVRYALQAEETTVGAARTPEAPRLTVFRKQGDVWLVVAHGNFSRIEQ